MAIPETQIQVKLLKVGKESGAYKDKSHKVVKDAWQKS